MNLSASLLVTVTIRKQYGSAKPRTNITYSVMAAFTGEKLINFTTCHNPNSIVSLLFQKDIYGRILEQRINLLLKGKILLKLNSQLKFAFRIQPLSFILLWYVEL